MNSDQPLCAPVATSCQLVEIADCTFRKLTSWQLVATALRLTQVAG